MWTVYMHTCPNGKKYIGITSKKTYERWKYGHGYHKQKFFNAIRKYGWENIKHETICQVESLKEAAEIETKLIAEYKTYEDEFGYNVSPETCGDYGMPKPRHTEETKKRMSDAAKARPMETRNLTGLLTHQHISVKGQRHNISAEGKYNQFKSCAKRVVQFDGEMHPIALYDSASTASRINNFNAYNPLQTGYKGMGFYWKYYDSLPMEEQDFVTKNVKEIYNYYDEERNKIDQCIP